MSRIPAYRHGFNPLKEIEKYTIQSSDVLDTLRINVRAEGSEEVLWYKERYLLGDEIVENLVDNKTLQPLFTIRRPARGGWYIRIHPSNVDPRRTHINLVPPPRTSSKFDDAALSFILRTNARPNAPSGAPPRLNTPPTKRMSSTQSVSSTSTHHTDSDSISSEATVVHSYPPTPPVNPPPMNPPSPSTVRAKLDQLAPSSPSTNSHTNAKPTTFIMAPHSSPHVTKPESAGLFSRALASIINHKPSHAASFTLCPISSVTVSSGTPNGPTTTSEAPAGNTNESERPTPEGSERRTYRLSRSIAECIPYAPPPLVTYHDQTPLWNFGSSAGLLEIDKGMETELGLQRGFVLAVSLAYMEYLTERESYIAASHG